MKMGKEPSVASPKTIRKTEREQFGVIVQGVFYTYEDYLKKSNHEHRAGDMMAFFASIEKKANERNVELRQALSILLTAFKLAHGIVSDDQLCPDCLDCKTILKCKKILEKE
jgi:hypothetical protein